MKKYNEREIALNLINKAEKDKSYINILLNQYFKKNELPNVSKAFITELIYGVIRHKNTLDWYLHNLCNLKGKKENLINILRLGAYQIIYLDKVPTYAIVNESVEIAKKHVGIYIAKFVNAILRNLERNYKTMVFPSVDAEPITHYSLLYSHPEWLVKLFLEKFDKNLALQILEANNIISPLTIRVNNLKFSIDNLKNVLINRNIKITESAFVPNALHLELNNEISINELEEYNKGYFCFQDEGSMFAGLALNPKENEIVLDLCAGPGGKITQISNLMNNKGRIVGCEIHPQRVTLITEACGRLGITNVELLTGDAREIKFTEKFDKILVDAPCSNLGVLRRRLDARWNKDIEDFSKLVSLQYELLEVAYNTLKSNGVLVYSTCTVLPEENEEVIYKFTQKHPDMKIENLKNISFSSVKNFISTEGFLKILPNKNHSMDGCFVARLVKNNGGKK